MNIYGYNLDDLENYFLSIGSKKFHAKQLFDWLYNKRIESFSEVTNLSKEVLSKVSSELSINRLKIVEVQKDVDVRKYLFELSDGEHIEAVLMRHDFGNSICVSSQVGCNMGCRFCESGRRKRVRNLETYEMVLQILMIEKDFGERISHVVVMGIGEPFDNYDNVMKFFSIINNPFGLAIGARHITVSTCGIVPKIKEFSKFPISVFHLNRKDEIGILGRNLQELYDTLEKNYRELEQKNNLLKEENKRQEVFLRASSHQLKTPVTAALLLTDGMINEIGKYKNVKQYLPEVKKQLQHMQVFDLTKL